MAETVTRAPPQPSPFQGEPCDVCGAPTFELHCKVICKRWRVHPGLRGPLGPAVCAAHDPMVGKWACTGSAFAVASPT